MGKKIKTQLQNATKIRQILRQVDVKLDYNGQPIETLLIYLPCKNGECYTDDLFEIIKKNILTHFVLEYEEIRKKLEIRKERPELLFKKALRKITTTTAQGELGELLLFTLLEVYFNAPKILSKMSAKDDPKTYVLGADAVHAQYIEEELLLYLGEAKTYKKFSDAASSATKSICNTMNDYIGEFDLIESNISFPDMTPEAEEEIIQLLNPFNENHFDPSRIYTPCFIGFEKKDLFCDDDEKYLDKYTQIAKRHIKTFYSKLEKHDYIEKTTLMLLPFSSIQDLVKNFTEYMGIEG